MGKMKREIDMTSHNQVIGKWGEKIAQDYLQMNGYEILQLNHRTPFGELDIIAREGGMLVFVEVKTRTSTSLGNPEGSVTPKKQQHLVNSALYYVSELPQQYSDWRVDVIAITGKPNHGLPEIQVFPNAIHV
jgi:putative endonuclease